MTQNNSSGPTWYDILGVDRDASPETIKAAWRDATDKFEPGTGAGQFRLFNEAADVLLDPAKRAEYDAGLEAPAAPVELAKPAPTPVADPVNEEPEVPEDAEDAADAETAESAEDAGSSAADPTQEPVQEPTGPAGGGIPVPVRAVAVLVVLAIASLVVAGVFALRLHNRVNAREDDANAAAEASAVASRALTAVLSYDYRHMDADRDRSVKFLTPKYRKDYVKTFDLLTEGPNGAPGGALKTKAVVTAMVQNTAVQDAGPDKVRVLAFVNQSSVKGSGTPAIFQNRVVVTMVKRGQDWLIDEVKSY
jgi:Mce-associated membrane protein